MPVRYNGLDHPSGAPPMTTAWKERARDLD